MAKVFIFFRTDKKEIWSVLHTVVFIGTNVWNVTLRCIGTRTVQAAAEIVHPVIERVFLLRFCKYSK